MNTCKLLTNGNENRLYCDQLSLLSCYVIVDINVLGPSGHHVVVDEGRGAVGVKLDWGIFLLLPLLPVLLSPPNPINPSPALEPHSFSDPPLAAAMYSA